MTSRWLVLRKGAAAAATAGVTPSSLSSSLARSSGAGYLGSALQPPYQQAAFSSASIICHPISSSPSSHNQTTTAPSSSSSLSNQLQQQQIRCKHSARQLNLKLINHPTVYRRRRRDERNEQLLQLLDDDDDEPPQQEHEQDVEVQPGDDEHVKVLVGTIYRFQRATIRAKPRYATWFTPEFLPNGWSAPPTEADVAAALSTTPLPFSIRRTGHKPNDAVGFLPVYSDHGRNDGTKVTTRIKKIQGNVQELVRELQAVLYQHHSNLPQPSPQPSPHPLLQMPAPLVRIPRIRIRAQGNVIEVDGNHVRTIKTWLAGLGF